MPDVKLFDINPSTGALRLAVGRPPEFVAGIDLLVQVVALDLLTVPGRSINNASKGGGIPSLIGINFDPDDPGELFSDIRLMVNRTESFIKQTQNKTSRQPSERLSELQLVDIVMDNLTFEIDVKIAIINEEGQLAEAAIPVQ